jgi:tRNA (uracil-5-)-methyltransferase
MAAAAADIPSAAELKAMVGPAGEEPGLNVVCRVDEYGTLLQAKLQKVQQLFATAEVVIPEAEVHTSPPAFFRFRADFRVWHLNSDKAMGKMFYAMMPKGERRPIEVPLFPMGSRRINELMPQLLAHVQPNQKLRKQLYEARFLTTLAGDSLITLIYHKPVDDEWKVEATKVAEALGVSIVGRSRKRKMVVGEEFVTEELTVLGEKYRYRQKEGAFSQPNPAVCQKMLTFAVECTRGGVSEQVDLLELYCG